MSRCAVCCARGLQKCGCVRRQSVKVLSLLRAISAKGSRAAAIKKRQHAAEKWGQLAQGMTKAQVAQVFYRRGYRNAYNQSYQSGYAKGWEACVKAMGRVA
jgi:flagellar biosynthesis/type III secretory pathway protein FliH